MKAILKIGCIALMLCFSFSSHSQTLKRVSDHVKRKVEQKAEQKIDRAIDDAVDDKPKDASKKEESSKRTDNGDSKAGDSNGQNHIGKGTTEFKTYSKFDFVPGDKIIAVEDFRNVPLGDFPDKWNTNSTGEIQTVEGRPDRWLSINKEGVFMPEFITSLPENFTFEFELGCDKNGRNYYYGGSFSVIFGTLDNPAKEFIKWENSVPQGKSAVICNFRPNSSSYEVWSQGSKTMGNGGRTDQFSKSKNLVKISIWRQKTRLRVYMNEEKVWDMPRAIPNDLKCNAILFRTGYNVSSSTPYLFTNLRLAAGAPDTRNRLITEGKFVTRGILFDVNSAEIKPESHGVLKEVADVLNENPDVRVRIVGHTDADGDDNSNLNLSKQRAEAVKNSLVQDFAIESSRFETDGKGESQPIDKNTMPEGKANNRRVEFVKL